MQEHLDWSDENQLAEVGELEAKRRRRSTCLSQKRIAVPRLRSAETRTRRTKRRSRPRTVGRTGQGWRRFVVAHLSTTGFERERIAKFYKCWVCSWRQLRSKNRCAERKCETARLIFQHSSQSTPSAGMTVSHSAQRVCDHNPDSDLLILTHP